MDDHRNYNENYNEQDEHEPDQTGLVGVDEGNEDTDGNYLGNNGEEDENDESVRNEERELIYNEDSGFQNAENLFDDQSQESAVYEIEFKIFDKMTKNVSIQLLFKCFFS